MEEIPKPNNNDLEKRILETKELLTFEQFTSNRKNGMKIYNNFPALFYNYGMLSDALRDQEFFKRFRAENPELEESLTENCSRWSKESSSSLTDIPINILNDLYRAYKIMLSYDEIKTNDDLFR